MIRHPSILVFLCALCVFVVNSSPARADWPEFRGPYGNGHVAADGETKPIGLPTTWSETENVRWKTEIPFKGWSTPVIMDGKIWLTTATEDGHDYYVLCVDADSGKILHNKKLFHSDQPEPLGNTVNMLRLPFARDRARPRVRSLRQLRHRLPRYGERRTSSGSATTSPAATTAARPLPSSCSKTS